MIRSPLLLFPLLLWPLGRDLQAQAQDNRPPQGPRAAIDQLAWIAGHWHGEALGGRVEEVWSPPLGDNMMGMFKLVKDNRTSFYELLTIVEKDGSLLLRLKHFDRELRGWEEKDSAQEFPLTSLSEREATFSGLTFRREDEQRLTITVKVDDNGAERELVFPLRRRP